MYTCEKAEQAAQNFIDAIKKGKIIKDTLPNSFENYTEYYEQADLESYKKFIGTFTYFECIEQREVVYNGE